MCVLSLRTPNLYPCSQARACMHAYLCILQPGMCRWVQGVTGYMCVCVHVHGCMSIYYHLCTHPRIPGPALLHLAHATQHCTCCRHMHLLAIFCPYFAPLIMTYMYRLWLTPTAPDS